MSDFHYSGLIYDLAKSTPEGSLNLLQNSLNAGTMADSIMYMTPNVDPTIGYTYPEYGTWGNQLLNPCLAIQQAMNSFQNGSWMNGLSGMCNFGFTPWSTSNFGNMFGGWNPWAPNGNGAGGTTGNSEYDALKALINKYKEIGTKNEEIGTKNNLLSPNSIDKINKALNKSGSTEEKLQALKDLYKSLSKTRLEKAMLELPEYKEALLGAGYKFNGTNKKGDSELEKELSSLDNDIEAKKGDKLALMFSSGSDAQILRKISYWNDKHSDSNSRGVIRYVANNIDGKSKEELTLQITGVSNIAESLMAKTVDMDGEFPKLEAAKEAVADKLIIVKTDGKFTKDNLMKLADECDKLYAMLRLMEAEKVRNSIKTKYDFINNISSTDTDFVNDNLVVSATKEDLKKEGITTMPETDNIPVEEREEISDIDDKFETPEEKIEELVTKENLQKTAKDGVYQTKTTSTNEPAHLYMIKDEKLVELKDVKAIDKDGNCTMIDNTKKKLETVETVEVSGQDVIDYQKAVKRVDDLVKDGSLIKCKFPNMPAGVSIYRSKGNKEDGYYEYYVVRNNKLMKIDCASISRGGWIMKEIGNNAQSKMYKNLTDDDFIEADTINTENLKEKKAKEATEAERKATEEKKAEAEAVVDKEYTKPEKVDTAYSNGKEVAELLMGNTNDDEWGEAYTLILKKMNKDNVHSFIEAYAKEEGGGTDNILEQIASEQNCGTFLGVEWLRGRRDTGERLKLINHIIKTVLDHCEEYGVKNEYAYTQLKEKYNNGKGITEKMINDEENTTIRKLDKWILKLLDIKD